MGRWAVSNSLRLIKYKTDSRRGQWGDIGTNVPPTFIIIRSNGSANIYLPISGRTEHDHRLPLKCLAGEGEMFCFDNENIIWPSQVFLLLLLISLKAFSIEQKKIGQSRAVFSWCLRWKI